MKHFRRLGFATCLTGLLSYLIACGAPRSPSRPHLVAADTAQIFSDGVISDANEQWRITFTADGETAYFAESAEFFPFTRQATIYVSQYADGKWSVPVVAPFSGTYSDIDPFISPNGQRLYFSSIRPVDGVLRGDIDIWMVERTATGWGDPIHLGPEVNSPADELYPSASADGTLYFASGPSRPQPGGNFDIYSATRNGDGFASRKPVGLGVNTAPSATDPNLQAAWEFNPEISADGKTLAFTSLRPGGFGLGDLYVSQMENGVWSAAKNLGPRVNTASDEYHPTFSRDQRDLYFVRRGPAKGNFYRISTRAIVPAFAQDVDSTKSRTTVSGAVTVTNNGISTVPSFSLGKPAAIFDVSIARSRFSLDPQIKYGLNGKPWSFLFWGRYKLVDGEKFRMTIGGHPAVNFRTTTVTINQTQREVIVARRFLAGELYPSYSMSKNVSVGAYYMYSRGFEQDVAKNNHFIALRSNLSKGLLSDRYFVQLSPQVYYLKADEPDGFYVYSGLTLGRRNFPLSFGAAANKVIETRVPGSENFLWNVSLTYSIR